MSFLTQEAFERADKERMGSFLTQEAFDRANAPSERMGDLGCPCKGNKGMGDMGCPCGDGGMGLAPDDPLANLTTQSAKVQATVSPYLWIFSIVGFGLALLNTSRVDSMWKKYGGSKFKGIKKPNF